MNGFLFLAIFFLLAQLAAALWAMGMGFDPPFVWWMFALMLLGFAGWRLTRNALKGYTSDPPD